MLGLFSLKGFKKMQESRILRAALYPRVSTEEQVLHGFSLDTQEETLKAYATEKGYKIVGIYRDEGFSARKPVLKRKIMQELLKDIEAGKIDIILFTKLDRWFRSVGEYHKVQNILDKHNVVWRTILEDYQTETADGRLKVNIMLSVAENEADRTSERIKFVFKGKLQRKEYCFGGRYAPFGYKVEKIDGIRRLLKDEETEPAVTAFWEKMIKYHSIRRAGREVNLEFNINKAHKTWLKIAKNELYTGEFKGIKEFCSPYISKDEWQEFQHPQRLIKSTQKNRVYLFTGLIKCPICGATLKSNCKTYPNDRTKEYYSYRCNAKSLGYCTYKHALSERKTEKYLISNIKKHLENYILDIEVTTKSPKKIQTKVDASKLNEQLRRLNNIYISGNMTDLEYEEKSSILRKAILKSEQEQNKQKQEINIGYIKNLLNADFEKQYNTFTREEKQRLWRSIIEEIHLNNNEITEIIFKT